MYVSYVGLRGGSAVRPLRRRFLGGEAEAPVGLARRTLPVADVVTVVGVEGMAGVQWDGM